MAINDIKDIIAGDETRTLELKKTTGELKDAMHSACAFLNTDGGWLIFGIAPTTLKILGQDVTDNTQREIAQALSGFEPAVQLPIEYIDVPEHPGKKVIALYFNAFVWGSKPYTYEGRPFYRVESTTKLMPRELFEERIRAHRPRYFSWEHQKAEGITIEDLDEERIRGAIRLGVERGRMLPSALTEPLDKVLDKLQLLTDGLPNNAATMLFSKKTYGYTQFILRMARFMGNDKLEFIDNQRAEGNSFDLLDAGMSFFFKHLSLSGKIVGLRREEHLEIPAEALREALVNALCHRQYEKYNLTIGIAIYDNRVEISNPGIFPPQITSANIKEPHSSYPYNPIIADVLFKTTFLENWGSGVSRIVEACRKQNLPDPIWSDKMGFITVTFIRPGYKLAEGSKYPSSTIQVPPKYPSSAPQVPPKYRPNIYQIEKLIECMSDSYMSMNELMEVCGLNDRKSFRQSYVIPALKEHAIERKYPKEPKHPKQMYKLTNQALEWKKIKLKESGRADVE